MQRSAGVGAAEKRALIAARVCVMTAAIIMTVLMDAGIQNSND